MLASPLALNPHPNPSPMGRGLERDDFRLSATGSSPFQGEVGWGRNTRAWTRCGAVRRNGITS